MKGKITISKSQDNHGHKDIRISITDDSSNITFFDGRMSLTNFSEALTGLGYVDIDFDVRGLESVGKTVERNTIEIFLGKVPYSEDRKKLALLESSKLESDGWLSVGYFGSSDSFFWKDDGLYCRAKFARYV